MSYTVADYDKTVDAVASMEKAIDRINRDISVLKTYCHKPQSKKVSLLDSSIFVAASSKVKSEEEKQFQTEETKKLKLQNKTAIDEAKKLLDVVFNDENKKPAEYKEFIESVFSVHDVLKCISTDPSQQKRSGNFKYFQAVNWDLFNYQFVFALIYFMINDGYNSLFTGNKFVVGGLWSNLGTSASRVKLLVKRRISEFKEINKLLQ